MFAKAAPDDGFPDGPNVDAGGFLWNEHYFGWRKTGYARDERKRQPAVGHVIALEPSAQGIAERMFAG